MQRMEVEWTDAQSHAGWLSHDEAKNLPAGARCFTIGYLIRDDEDGVLLVRDWNEDEMGDAMFIPKPLIREMRELMVK